MDDFEDFEITQDILTEIENIEINLLDKTLNLSSDDDEEKIQPPDRVTGACGFRHRVKVVMMKLDALSKI